MTREDFEKWEALLMKEVVRRRALGGYSADASTILILSEILYEVVRHLRERSRLAKTKDGATD